MQFFDKGDFKAAQPISASQLLAAIIPAWFRRLAWIAIALGVALALIMHLSG